MSLGEYRMRVKNEVLPTLSRIDKIRFDSTNIKANNASWRKNP